MWQRFTERARRAILLGQEEASKEYSKYVGTEHLLQGVLHEDDGAAAELLQKLGVSLRKVQRSHAEIELRGESGAPQLTPKAQHLVKLAVDEAGLLGHDQIETEHLLLGVLRQKEELAAEILRVHQDNLQLARAEVAKHLNDKDS